MITYLAPEFDSAKSFYNKATVEHLPGAINLYSYNTLAATYTPDMNTFVVHNLSTQTTVRHVREFAQQCGLPYMTKAELECLR